MAKIKAGILSKVSGKVAGVVGGTWKGTNYLRELVKPSNPNTPLQQAQRSKMSFVVKVARQLIGDVLNPYLNKFCKTMSGYNYFCKENIRRIGGEPLAFTSAPVLSFGTLGSGTFDTERFSNDGEMAFSAGPAVPTSHTLKLVETIISENGDNVQVHIANGSASGSNAYFALRDLPAGVKGWYGAFWADFDANGVLQQISATTSVEFTGVGE